MVSINNQLILDEEYDENYQPTEEGLYVAWNLFYSYLWEVLQSVPLKHEFLKTQIAKPFVFICRCFRWVL